MYVSYPITSCLIPVGIIIIVLMIRIGFMHDFEWFPGVDLHSRWDSTWQVLDHPAVQDWLKAVGYFQRQFEETEEYWYDEF